MTLTSEKILHKSIYAKKENSSVKKKPVGKNENCFINKNNERGISAQEKLIKPPFSTTFQQKIAYEIFENPRGKYKLTDLVPTSPSQENSKGVRNFVKQISKVMVKENPFKDSHVSRENNKVKKLASSNAYVKIKQNAKSNCDRNSKKMTNKPSEVRERPLKQNVTPAKTIRKSSDSSICGSDTKPRRGPADQVPSNSVKSDSVGSVSAKTSVASHSYIDENSYASGPEGREPRTKKLKRSEIPLRKTLSNALNKKKPTSVSLLMKKSLEEVESDVSIDFYKSFMLNDSLSLTTEWSNDGKTSKEVSNNNSESENTFFSDDFVEDTHFPRISKTANTPPYSRISSLEVFEKTSVNISKAKTIDSEVAKTSAFAPNKSNNSAILQRLESLHQQTVSIKEKQNPSATPTESKELISKSSFSSQVSKKLKRTSTRNQQKNLCDNSDNRSCDKSPSKVRTKKKDKETKEKANSLPKKGQVNSRSEISQEKSLNKNERQLSVRPKELEKSDSKSSGKSKQSFALKEKSTNRKNLKEAEDVKKSQNNKLGLISRDDSKKSLNSSTNMTSIDGGSDSLKIEKDEDINFLRLKEEMRESERAEHLLQLLIGQIPTISTLPEDYLKYREIVKVVNEITSSSTLPLNFIEAEFCPSPPKKLPRSRNKFSAKGKSKKVKSDKIDLQEEMEKLYQPSSYEIQLNKKKNSSKLETEDKSEMDKEDNIEVIVDISPQETLKDLAGIIRKAERELEKVSSSSLSHLTMNYSLLSFDEKQQEEELLNTKEKQEKIDKNFEETSQPEKPDTVKKPPLANAVHENSSKISNNLKPKFVGSKGLLEKKKWYLNSPEHFSSAPSVKVKNKKSKPETKLRRTILKSFDKMEKSLSELFEEVAAVKLKRRNSEPNSFRGFVRKTTDLVISKSNRTSASSLCSSLRHLNTDELEDFRVWETVPTKMTSCWEVSLYHFRRPWSVLSCSVFKDNRRASTPGIILENLRNGGSLELKGSTASQKSKVITPKEASFDVEPSIAQKNMDIRNWLAALNFQPPPSISSDVLNEINCCNLPAASSSQSKVVLKKRKIPRRIKFSEETLSAKFSKNPGDTRKWSLDLPKSKELVRRKSGGYVAVSRESQEHTALMKQAFDKTYGRPKKENLVKHELKVKKCKSVSYPEQQVEKFIEKVSCGIQVDDSEFYESSHEDIILRMQEPQIVENDFWNSATEMQDSPATAFYIWKYLFFVSLSIIIYDFFSRHTLGSTI